MENAYDFIRDYPKVLTSNHFNETTARAVINVIYEERLPPTLSPTLSQSPSVSIQTFQPSLKVLASEEPSGVPSELT